MRILFCNYEYPPLGGGGGIGNAMLAEELARRHEVFVLTSRALGLQKISESNGVQIVLAPAFFRRRHSVANMPSMLAYLVMGARAGKQLLQHVPIDLVNSHFVLPTGPLGAFLARWVGVPHIISVHVRRLI